jgi:hypothetical protein
MNPIYKLAISFFFLCLSLPAAWLMGTYGREVVDDSFILIFAPSLICILLSGWFMHLAEKGL